MEKEAAVHPVAEQFAWRVTHEIDFGSRVLVHGVPQFGFHDRLGNSYLLHNERNFIGLVQDDRLVWTAGAVDPALAPLHLPIALQGPKFVCRAYLHDALLISDENAIYKLDLSSMEVSQLLEKSDAGIVDMGNCVCDFADNIWVNDIRGCKILRFLFDGTLVDIIGNGTPGFQMQTVPFSEAKFRWIYDIRLGPDGTLYVLDSKNYAVRKIDPCARTVSTICGDGIGGYCGDGGDARLARLGANADAFFDGPWSLFVEDNGTVYIGDTQNHAIRRIDSTTGRISTIAGGLQKTAHEPPVFFEKICGMDFWNSTLYVPDWRETAPNTLIVLEKDGCPLVKP
jgi:hypothetical protein